MTFSFFLEVHYLNTELYNFIKNQIEFESLLDIKTEKKHPIIKGNLLIISGSVKDEFEFKKKVDLLISIFNNYTFFLTILSIYVNGYWFSLSSYMKTIEAIIQKNKFLLLIEEMKTYNLFTIENSVFNTLTTLNLINESK